MVFENYREVVAPDEAERYWSIRPKVIGDNRPPDKPRLGGITKTIES
jgi:hypothetical protein